MAGLVSSGGVLLSAGATGQTGPRGRLGPYWQDGADGEDAPTLTAIGSRTVFRGDLAWDARNWRFLGRGTASNAVRTTLVSWVGEYEQLWFEYNITGYSGNAIGRVIVGPAAEM
jgi:hypothetical protein